SINLFDYHQRVPTQIDWFKLLKSGACESHESFEAEVHFSEITERVKHFFKFSFLEAFPLLTLPEALRHLPCQ
ncbi:hypothetical protein EXA23_13865, partial [Vibrio cincinnatiensis]|uniref:hypothetical protein n=1 Tax=Vibrio cincinnatiensis TaxID=675 RepID=UPI001EE0AB77